MLKDYILQILNINKEIIKDSFNIAENGIDNIRNILKNDHENFKQIMEDIFSSEMGIREKKVISYLIGYVNGERKEKMEEKKR